LTNPTQSVISNNIFKLNCDPNYSPSAFTDLIWSGSLAEATFGSPLISSNFSFDNASYGYWLSTNVANYPRLSLSGSYTPNQVLQNPSEALSSSNYIYKGNQFYSVSQNYLSSCSLSSNQFFLQPSWADDNLKFVVARLNGTSPLNNPLAAISQLYIISKSRAASQVVGTVAPNQAIPNYIEFPDNDPIKQWDIFFSASVISQSAIRYVVGLNFTFTSGAHVLLGQSTANKRTSIETASNPIVGFYGCVLQQTGGFTVMPAIWGTYRAPKPVYEVTPSSTTANTTGVIVGVTLGTLLFLSIVLLLVVFFVYRWRESKKTLFYP